MQPLRNQETRSGSVRKAVEQAYPTAREGVEARLEVHMKPKIHVCPACEDEAARKGYILTPRFTPHVCDICGKPALVYCMRLKDEAARAKDAQIKIQA